MKILAAVCDGNTIGHPCCGVHDCKVPLANYRQRFCPEHASFDTKCAIVDCSLPHAQGHKTCDFPEHRVLENSYFRQGNAMFQLKARLSAAGVTIPGDSAARSTEEDSEVIIESVPTSTGCGRKSESGNCKLRACFGHRWTHNEQLIMRPCGIILSHGTFYGSEVVSAVNVHSSPNIIFPSSFTVDADICQGHIPFASVNTRILHI